jgi:four helix bundle protein
MPGKARIHSFTQLDVWQRAKELHGAICAATKQESFRREFKLVGQIKDSSSSVMANIAEGFEKGSRPEFHKYVCIAKGSAGETLSHLHAALSDGCITQEQFEAMNALAIRIGQMLGALRKAVQPPPKRGRG